MREQQKIIFSIVILGIGLLFISFLLPIGLIELNNIEIPTKLTFQDIFPIIFIFVIVIGTIFSLSYETKNERKKRKFIERQNRLRKLKLIKEKTEEVLISKQRKDRNEIIECIKSIGVSVEEENMDSFMDILDKQFEQWNNGGKKE